MLGIKELQMYSCESLSSCTWTVYTCDGVCVCVWERERGGLKLPPTWPVQSGFSVACSLEQEGSSSVSAPSFNLVIVDQLLFGFICLAWKILVLCLTWVRLQKLVKSVAVIECIWRRHLQNPVKLVGLTGDVWRAPRQWMFLLQQLSCGER